MVKCCKTLRSGGAAWLIIVSGVLYTSFGGGPELSQSESAAFTGTSKRMSGSAGDGVLPARKRGMTHASKLPRLPEGQHVGVLYTDLTGAARERADKAWHELLSSGASAYELSLSWKDLESAPGVARLDAIRSWLAILSSADLNILVVIPTIDTNNLLVPEDLADPHDPRRLKPGVRFSDPDLIERFGSVLDALIPELLKHKVVALSVGNEVDVWFPEHRDQLDDFLTFLHAAQARVARHTKDIPVGATVTYGGFQEHPRIARRVLDASQVAIFTYYPWGAGFKLTHPFELGSVYAKMVAAAGKKPVILQELGCWSGHRNASGPSPSEASPKRQAEFFRLALAELPNHPQIRFVSILTLADWSRATVDHFTTYYGLDLPAFAEFLGTLGILWEDGTRKPAFRAVRDGIRELRRAQPKSR
jgi:hypothetical protein